MKDILFRTNDYIFSYRVAGICVQNGKLLLQKPTNDCGFSFPGGHVSFGDTNEATLIREFREEIGVMIQVGKLRWVAEIFFQWGDKPCHQLCMFYDVKLNDASCIPLAGSFIGQESIEGNNFAIEFHWIPLNQLDQIPLYPKLAKLLLKENKTDVQHFVYDEINDEMKYSK